MAIKSTNKRFEIVMPKDEFECLEAVCKELHVKKSHFICVATDKMMQAVIKTAEKQNKKSKKARA